MSSIKLNVLHELAVLRELLLVASKLLLQSIKTVRLSENSKKMVGDGF